MFSHRLILVIPLSCFSFRICLPLQGVNQNGCSGKKPNQREMQYLTSKQNATTIKMQGINQITIFLQQKILYQAGLQLFIPPPRSP